MGLSIAKKLWHLLTLPERRWAILLLGLMMIGMVLETLGIGLVVPAIALLTQPDYAERFPALKPFLTALGNPSPRALVVGAMLGLTAAYLIKNLFLAFLTFYQTRFAYGVQARLSQRLFAVYLRQPYPFHLQRNSAQLLRNVIGEVDQLRGAALVPGMTLLTETLVVIGLCALLLFVEPVGALIVLCVLGTAAWGSHRVTRTSIARWGLERQRHEGLRVQHLQQGFGGIKDLKLLGREVECLEQYRPHNERAAHVAQMQFTLLQYPRMWLELLAVAGLAILVIVMLAQGRSPASVLPTLGLFGAVAFRLIPSMNRVLSAIQLLRYGLPVINTLTEELQLEPRSEDVSTAETAPLHDSIKLREVSYTYPKASTPALKSLTVAIHRGESVGFIGTSGAGKSTLVDVLLGLLRPDAGEVLVDGSDIQGSMRPWQNQIGYVPQSIYLTDDTLRRNIAFSLPNQQIDDVAVWRSLRAAQLEEFVSALPEGLDTMVGERGVRLSGGQRQRIGIARALYHDPAVLVLDEATSSLDTATELGVMQAVMALHGGKTIVIVAHRISTVEHCDRLYRLEKGRIVDEGTPMSLLPSMKAVQ